MTKSKQVKPRIDDETANLVDLERLSQQQAAVLVGKPAVWMRDNAHLFRRNDDGSYDAQDVVRATQAKFRAAELPDNELESVLQFCDDVADWAVGSFGHTARLFERIEQAHGASGLAAIACQLLATMRDRLEQDGDPETETAEQIQQQAEEKISRLESARARREYRKVLVCESCNHYRWGRSWKSGRPPSGYVASGDICSDCEKAARRKRRG